MFRRAAFLAYFGHQPIRSVLGRSTLSIVEVELFDAELGELVASAPMLRLG